MRQRRVSCTRWCMICWYKNLFSISENDKTLAWCRYHNFSLWSSRISHIFCCAFSFRSSETPPQQIPTKGISNSHRITSASGFSAFCSAAPKFSFYFSSDAQKIIAHALQPAVSKQIIPWLELAFCFLDDRNEELQQKTPEIWERQSETHTSQEFYILRRIENKFSHKQNIYHLVELTLLCRTAQISNFYGVIEACKWSNHTELSQNREYQLCAQY